MNVLLLDSLVSLIRQTVQLCDKHSFALESIPAFSNSNFEWLQHLLKIYEKIYTSDCERSLKMQKKAKSINMLGLLEH